MRRPAKALGGENPCLEGSNPSFSVGGVAERSNAAVSKTVRGGFVPRGFKSLPLRSTKQVSRRGLLPCRDAALVLTSLSHPVRPLSCPRTRGGLHERCVSAVASSRHARRSRSVRCGRNGGGERRAHPGERRPIYECDQPARDRGRARHVFPPRHRGCGVPG